MTLVSTSARVVARPAGEVVIRIGHSLHGRCASAVHHQLRRFAVQRAVGPRKERDRVGQQRVGRGLRAVQAVDRVRLPAVGVGPGLDDEVVIRIGIEAGHVQGAGVLVGNLSPHIIRPAGGLADGHRIPAGVAGVQDGRPVHPDRGGPRRRGGGASRGDGLGVLPVGVLAGQERPQARIRDPQAVVAQICPIGIEVRESGQFHRQLGPHGVAVEFEHLQRAEIAQFHGNWPD